MDKKNGQETAESCEKEKQEERSFQKRLESDNK